MKKIRIGNDFVFNWAIERGGLPEDLSSVLEKHLYLSVLGKRVELIEGVDYDITGNVVRIEVTPAVANILGTYKAEFHYILPDNGLIDEDRKCAVDVDAFIIVGSTAQADEPSEFTVTSDMAIAFKGDKGDPLTYDDLTPEQIAELQQPATDAIASIQEVELAVETAEGLRQQAELNRQTNTSTAILNAEQATDDANDAAILANEKAGLAATATTEANTARDEANLAATAANTKAGDANDAAEAANTAAGLADTARLAIQSDLALKADEADLVQLAGEVSLLDAVQGAKIKDIEDVLSTANLGQSTQVSVSGRKIVSLPKNAANGGMQVKLEGLTAENLVVNGDFRSGTTGWLGVLGTISTANNELTYKVDSLNANAMVEQQIDIAIPGHKYYARVYINPKYTNNVNLSMGTPVVTVAVNMANAWNRVSAIITATSNARFRFYLNTISPYVVGDTIKLKDIMTIDLTATFGAGNEPDLATCDAMFSDYFEGKKNFVPTGRVMSVGRNIISPRMIVSNLRKSGYMYADISDYGGVPAVRFSRTDLLGVGVYIDVKCEENTQYTMSTKFHFDTYGNELNQFHFGFVYSDGSLGTLSFNPSQQDQKKTLISALGKTITQIRFLRQYPTAGDSGRLYEIKLERGSGATTYEPHKETSLYLTSPELRSNGTVKDEVRKGTNGYELVKRINEVDGTVLATPVISPISYGGILNSAESGTVYHEPVIADAGVYGTNMPILLTDYPIASIEEIIKHENGVDTYLDVSTAVIAGNGLSFTHPDLTDGDLVLFTYAFAKETTNGNITATFYDSNVVKIDTVTGKAYKINEVVTNGVLTRTLTEV